jgi:transcriptional regulator with XRE-family HTH domain
VSASPESEQDFEQGRQFAVVLNHLFATRLTPTGRPYTLTEVSKATGLSVPYLSILRKGTIGAVSLHRAATLARFFRVPLDYFSQEGLPVDTTDDLVREALAQPLVREVALRAAKVDVAQRALLLQMLEQAEHVLQEKTLTQPLVREVALRAGKVGVAQRALVLQMLEHADQVLQELATPPAQAGSAPPEAAPGSPEP